MGAKYTAGQHEAVRKYRDGKSSFSMTLTNEQKQMISDKAKAKELSITQYILSLVEAD